MCAIAGKFGSKTPPKERSKCLKIMERRGPEGSKEKILDKGWIAHTALGFVRVGNNPQPLEKEGHVLVFNGEIYNWRELARDHHWDSKTDTEVLLEGLLEKGLAFLPEMEGQFAFLLYRNTPKGWEVLFGRDRWGISPLVYGKAQDGQLAFASTAEALEALGVPLTEAKTVPAGCSGVATPKSFKMDFWYELPKVAPKKQIAGEAKKVRDRARASVKSHLTDDPSVLFTALGGIDSQFVTACAALEAKGKLGGAITIVPWDPSKPDGRGTGDLPLAAGLIAQLTKQGIKLAHHTPHLSPEVAEASLDRVLKVLGPDYFNIACGLAEDLVAQTAKANGGKAILTAGGPDEAGRSYKPWSLLHRDRLEEGFHAVCDQFSYSEGVRAGLVFGELGVENRVPLAHLIDEFTAFSANQKQVIFEWGDGKDPMTIKMDDKILWREAVRPLLPAQSLATKKETLHAATGTKEVLFHLAKNDKRYQRERLPFLAKAVKGGWRRLIFAPPIAFKKKELPVPEGQLYCLWRWAKLEPQAFLAGASRRYGGPFYNETLAAKSKRPLCHDWMPAPKLSSKQPRPSRSHRDDLGKLPLTRSSFPSREISPSPSSQVPGA